MALVLLGKGLAAASQSAPFVLLGRALRAAAETAGLQAMLMRRRTRLAVALGVARCLNAVAIGLLVSASTAMLYELCGQRRAPLPRRFRRALPAKGKAQPPPTKSQNHATTAEGDAGGVPPGEPGIGDTSSAAEGSPEPEDEEDVVFERQLTPASVHQTFQNVTTGIGTVVTMVDFFTGPLIGRFMDAAGRRPTIIVALLISGVSRLGLATSPSLRLYFAYRVVTALTSPAFFGATMAAMRDLYGRGTQEFTIISSKVQRYALLSMITGTYLGRMLPRDPRFAFIICGALQLTGAGVALAVVQETIPVRSKMQWSLRKVSPVSFIEFFGKSRALAALAVLSVVRDLHAHLNIHAVYRRQRFVSWGQVQESTQMILSQIFEFLSTYWKPWLLDYLGPLGAVRLHSWLCAVIQVNSAFAPRPESLYLNPVASAFLTGHIAVDRFVQREAQLLDLGQGELGAETANRDFVPALVMPHVYSRLHRASADRGLPWIPYVLAAVLSLFSAELVAPWAFKQLSASTLASGPSALRK